MDKDQKHIPFAVMVVDSELKGRIQAAVMDMIANFEIVVI